MRWCALLLLAAGCDSLFGLAAIGPPDLDASADTRALDGAPGDQMAVDAQLPAGIVAWFPLDGVDRNNRIVELVAGNHGACAPGHCPALATGVRGAALRFDGSTSVITALPAAALDTANSYTIAVWVHAEDDGGTNYGCAINKIFGSGGGNSWQFCTYAGQWNFYPGAVSTAVDYAAWHHLAATWDMTTQELRIYVDGALTGAPTLVVPSFDGGSLTIGADDDAGQQMYFYKGALDDFRVYSRVLDTGELTTLASP